MIKTYRFLISPSEGRLSFDQVGNKIKNFLKTPGRYRIIIGTDSQPRDGKITYISAIIAHRIGKGGIYFYRKSTHTKPTALEERILNEATYSLELAEKIKEKLFPLGLPQQVESLEIHLDIGMRGRTKSLVNTVIGMIKSCGYKAVIKPDSYGATKVADKHSK